jgi:integrase/recombinase XerD
MQNHKRQITFLTREEVKNMIAVIPPTGTAKTLKYNLRDRALLLVLFSTGLRVSECLALPRAPFQKQSDSGAKTILDSLELSITGKGGWQRTVYFSHEALQAVYAYLEARWDEDVRLFPIKPRMAQLIVKKRAEQAGIEKQVTPHVFRHSLATDLLRNGVDIAFVSKFLGHRSLDNTMIYTHVVNSQLKEIHERLYK